VWLACAFGQKYCDLKKNNADAADIAAAHSATVEEVRTAVGLHPDAQATLLSVWQPAPGSVDDDLACFGQDDPDLVKLLKPTTAG
jgi:hypothetical protein